MKYRYERKYRIDTLPYQQVVALLRLHPAGFRPLYPDRQINNIYLDTPALETFYDNMRGIAIRKKYRIRWYGTQAPNIQQSQLEIKAKEGLLGTKAVFALPNFHLPLLPNLPTDITLPPALKPILLNTYQRSYFATPNGHFRITIDRQLRFTGFNESRSHYTTPSYYQTPEVILELKYDQEQEEKGEWIQQYLSFRNTKYSKYVTGVLASFS